MNNLVDKFFTLECFSAKSKSAGGKNRGFVFLRMFQCLILTFFCCGHAWASGSVTGTVKFEGEAPIFKTIKMDADPICALSHSGPTYPQGLVLGEGKGMANVIVRIKNVPQGEYAVPTGDVVIDQKGCNYFPHVSVVRAGQKVKFLNPDGTLHNVHAMSQVNQPFNASMPKSRTEIEKVFNKPEAPFSIKCDVHPWMNAWIMVTDNPYAAVTDRDGKFIISNLPAGKYDIEAWHERLGIKTATVTIVDGETQTTDFTFFTPH